MDTIDGFIVKKSKSSKRGKRGLKVSPQLTSSPVSDYNREEFNEEMYHKSEIYKKIKERWDYDLFESSKMQKKNELIRMSKENIVMQENMKPLNHLFNVKQNSFQSISHDPPGLIRPVYLQPEPIRPPVIYSRNGNGNGNVNANSMPELYQRNEEFREYIPSPPLFVEKQYYDNNPFIPTQRIIENESINF